MASPESSAPPSPTRTAASGMSEAAAAPEPALDWNALDALAWIEGGMPDDRVRYGLDAPKLTEDQLAGFAPASSMPRRPRKKG